MGKFSIKGSGPEKVIQIKKKEVPAPHIPSSHILLREKEMLERLDKLESKKDFDPSELMDKIDAVDKKEPRKEILHKVEVREIDYDKIREMISQIVDEKHMQLDNKCDKIDCSQKKEEIFNLLFDLKNNDQKMATRLSKIDNKKGSSKGFYILLGLNAILILINIIKILGG